MDKYLPESFIEFFKGVKKAFNRKNTLGKVLTWLVVVWIVSSVLSFMHRNGYLGETSEIREMVYIENQKLIKAAKRNENLNRVNDSLERVYSIDSLKQKYDYYYMQLQCEKIELEIVRDSLYKLK